MARVASHGDFQAREGVWIYSAGNGNPLWGGFKLAGDLVRRSSGCSENGLEAEARTEEGKPVRSALLWPGGRWRQKGERNVEGKWVNSK